MNQLVQLLNNHFLNHPEMEVLDAVKFLYQHYMGPGHLISNEQAVFERLQAEWDCVEADHNAPLYEFIGAGLCRLNLNKCKALGLSAQTTARLFILTAKQIKPNQKGLEESLDLVYALPFSRELVDEYLSQYRAQGCPMVSHSDRFRQCYSPAYRIVSQYYAHIIPVLCAIDLAMASQPCLRVAIDGPCASGKSTLGCALTEIYNCPLIHMDDFFLRPAQRTPERLAQPGGNVDYERFSQEVLSPLLAGKTACYRPYLCHNGQFGSEVTVAHSPLTVVEGSYSLRPDLRDAYDVRIWVEAPWEVRRQRLLERGGLDCLSRFESLWIPMEESYFEHCQVKQCCNIHFCSN